MEYFDFHTHIAATQDMMTQTTLDFIGRTNSEALSKMDEFGSNPDAGAKYLKNQGVRYAVVLAEIAPATSGLVPNETVIEYCSRHEMLIPFACINPLVQQDCAEKLETYVKEGNMKGLKLLPSYQFFYPNDKSLYPVYAKASELGIPVVYHIGSSMFKGTKMKYCDPIYLDEVAVDFPDLKIVMAHSGRGFWYDQCFFLSRFHKNVYMDITGLPPKKLLTYFPELDRNGDKVIFGSDWPAVPTGIKENIKAIEDLPLSDRTIEAILYKNAYKLVFG
jgi:predicted TIM-barrel fold metal-dependent hydrolase